MSSGTEERPNGLPDLPGAHEPEVVPPKRGRGGRDGTSISASCSIAKFSGVLGSRFARGIALLTHCAEYCIIAQACNLY